MVTATKLVNTDYVDILLRSKICLFSGISTKLNTQINVSLDSRQSIELDYFLNASKLFSYIPNELN